MSAMKVSIVIPVFRSEDCVEETVRAVFRALKKLKFDVILVNDRSPDGSWEAIRRICARHANVTALNLRKNAGQDNAIMAGFARVTGDYVVIMDDDLQHDPQHIPALVAELEKGYDVCYANFRRKRQAWWKNIGSAINGRIARFMIGKPRHIYLSPFKALRREIVEEVLRYTGPFAYVDGLILQATENLTQIDVDHHERYAGKGNYNLVRSVAVFMKLATSFSIAPLRFASLLGFAIAAFGIFLGIFYVVQYFITETVVQGWTTITVLVLLIGGMILTCLGLIGEYLGRTYLNLNHKPQYVVGEVLNGRSTRVHR